jgi:hypothetical protein
MGKNKTITIDINNVLIPKATIQNKRILRVRRNLLQKMQQQHQQQPKYEDQIPHDETHSNIQVGSGHTTGSGCPYSQ